ncbi:MAG TPA: hypothetical protein VHX68_12065 [Planctomycetaceae bacterium]|nr:hypothetical protein [Planctomycetaceae bacterium]
MNNDYSIHLEFRGMGGPEGLRPAALAEATAFPEDRFSDVATTERGSRWFPTAGKNLIRIACAFAFTCALVAATSPEAVADFERRGELQQPGTLNVGERIVAVQLLTGQREPKMPIGPEAPDVLLRILVYGSALGFVAILIGNRLSRERRLVSEIHAGTKRRRKSRQTPPPAALSKPSVGRVAPVEESAPIWQDAPEVQGRGIVTVP